MHRVCDTEEKYAVMEMCMKRVNQWSHMELKGVNALNKDLPLSTWRIIYDHSVNDDDKTRPMSASQLEAPLSSGGVKFFFSYITKARGPST